MSEVFQEVKCCECGKNFIPAPQHRFRINGKWFCKWSCYFKYEERKERLKREKESIPKPITVTLPCKIGDTVWAIRRYRNIRTYKQGKVSEMYFIDGMRLCIAVKNVGRGEWGKDVFATKEDAEKPPRGEL